MVHLDFRTGNYLYLHIFFVSGDRLKKVSGTNFMNEVSYLVNSY